MITRELIIFVVVLAIILITVSKFINPVLGIFIVSLSGCLMLDNGKNKKPK